MRPPWRLLFMLCLLPSSLAAQPVFMESALVLDAPGYRGIWPAWFDGEEFWIQGQPFMELLGYEIVASDSTELTARDRRHAITFDFAENRIHVNGEERFAGNYATVGSDGQMLVSMDAIQKAFESNLVWDVSGLTLTLSSAAKLFDASQFGDRQVLDMEVPQNILFPRERNWLGGLHIGYTLMHEWHASTGRSFTPTGRMSAHLAGGTVRWNVTRQTSRLHYSLDFESPWLTRIEAGQRGDGWGVQFSNRSLQPRRVHREEVREGRTLPHAIVRGSVSGAVSEQVQADREGRYAIRHPVVYGSTEASIEVEPLGGESTVISETHWITPYAMLPPGHVEYDVQLSTTPSGEVGWGMTSRLTLQASASQSPRHATVRVHALPLPTMYLDAEIDLVERSLRSDFQWWRPWGGLDGAVHVQREPTLSELFTTNFTFAAGGGSLQVGMSHQRTDVHSPRTSILSILGWQFAQKLRVQTGVHVRLREPESVSVRPRLTYSLPLARPRVHLQASAVTRSRQIESWQGGTLVSGKSWSGGIKIRRSMQSDGVEIHGTLQVNTEWAWLDARGGWAEGDFYHAQTLRGTIMIGEDIRFGALYEERTQAIFRLFIDTNLNGELDADEALSLGHQLQVGYREVSHQADGEVVAPNLIAYDTYPVHIRPESIRDPLLHPATGYQFHFVASPGRTRYIDIPLQHLPTVSGRLTGWPGSYTIMQVHVRRGEHTHELDVYQDGGFVARLAPGNYQVTVMNLLTGETVGETALTVTVGENFPVIQLDP